MSEESIQTPIANAGLKEYPAFDLITVDSIAGNGGIESPFVSNKKLLIKYSFSHEVIQACKNIAK